MPRPQFTLRALLVLMFGAACFFGGIHFERERRARPERAERAFQEFLEKSGQQQRATMIDEDTMVIDMVSPRRVTVIPDGRATTEKSAGQEQPASP